VLCTFLHQGFSEKVQRSGLALAGKCVGSFSEAIVRPVGRLYLGSEDCATSRGLPPSRWHKAGLAVGLQRTQIAVRPPIDLTAGKLESPGISLRTYGSDRNRFRPNFATAPSPRLRHPSWQIRPEILWSRWRGRSCPSNRTEEKRTSAWPQNRVPSLARNLCNHRR
jgi:hypothetical protein